MSTPRSKATPQRVPAAAGTATKQSVPPARTAPEANTGHQSYAERLVARRMTKDTPRARAAGR
ncbi:MAG TPA: hypothetical protein PLF26_05115 [Blastocatellia bacterium]|nr:hypothetical protein [Blastocatellia bacterium]